MKADEMMFYSDCIWKRMRWCVTHLLLIYVGVTWMEFYICVIQLPYYYVFFLFKWICSKPTLCYLCNFKSIQDKSETDWPYPCFGLHLKWIGDCEFREKKPKRYGRASLIYHTQLSHLTGNLLIIAVFLFFVHLLVSSVTRNKNLVQILCAHPKCSCFSLFVQSRSTPFQVSNSTRLHSPDPIICLQDASIRLVTVTLAPHIYYDLKTEVIK